jgi:O-succinylbenzoate synthase
LIGGTKEIVSVGADIPVLSTTDELLKRVEISIQRGFPRIKLKFNRQCTVDMIKQVRNAFPRLIMHIDCNSGFTLDDIAMFQELDKLDLKMIEQPLSYDDLVDHAELRKTIQTPICLDESITSLHRATKAIKIGACDWINIKTSRVGGLTNGIAIHDLCEANGVPVWIGGMLESAVGQGPSLALATKSNVCYPSDVFPSDRFFAQDFSCPDICISAPGEITAPSSNGMGFSPKMGLLEKHSVAKASITLQ